VSQPRPIKVLNTALSETTNVDEVLSKPHKLRKRVFLRKKDVNCGALISKMRGLLTKRQKELIFLRKIPMDQEAFLKNQKRPDTKEISP
jgi:hypothetical protein